MGSSAWFPLLFLVAVVVFVFALPPPPDFTADIQKQCRYGNKICKKGGNTEKCGDRYKLCPEYANKAIDVVWSFCMYSNEDNIALCEERMKIEFERIAQEIRNDSWELNF